MYCKSFGHVSLIAESLELSKITTFKERWLQLCIDLYQKIKDDCTKPLHGLLPAENVQCYNLIHTKTRMVCPIPDVAKCL